ncbi:MAG: amidohydrolase family protein [Anaerovoracaceae bacterium]
MAFGFFKKVEAADLILHNGHVFTQNPELPWASAVACKGEEIMAVGNFDDMDGIIGNDTQIIDLDGKYVFPGFIDIHRSPVLKTFEGRYADLSECSSPEDVAEAIRDWADENPDNEIIFGYGYRDDLKPEDGEEDEFSASSRLLDEVCPDKPVLLLCTNCIDCWTNSTADRIIVDTAEEECVDTVTVGYVLNLLIPFDFDVIEESVRTEISDLADKGFTSVLNLQSPDYFESLYQDSIIGLYNEGQMRQRFFGSYFMNRPLLPQGLIHRLMSRRTNCLELGGMIHAEMLNLYLDNSNSPVPFTQDSLNKILEDVCDKGFEIFLEAIEKEDLLMAYDALEHVRSKGYKNMFVIASDCQLSSEDTADLIYWESAFKTWGTNVFSPGSLTGSVTSVEEAIDHLTVDAAAVVGMSEKLGSLEAGKLADMAIFDENLFDLDLKLLPRIHASITVLGGEIVYDADAENDMEMYNLMASQQL